MATKRNSRKTDTKGPARLGKPRGIIQQRVQEVGPQRFAIVSIDCGKPASKWMMCDFYARVLLPPQEVEHGQAQMQLATVQVKEAYREHGIRDTIVAVEMTGTYHRPIQRAFRQAGFETRLVHPFASSHYRLPSHGDNKTDDNDLEASRQPHQVQFPLSRQVSVLEATARDRHDPCRRACPTWGEWIRI